MVELIEDSTVPLWLIAVNPTITIIAIAAAAPARIPVLLLDEKLNVKLVCESEFSVLDLGWSLILVLDFPVEGVFSSGLLIRCSSMSD